MTSKSTGPTLLEAHNFNRWAAKNPDQLLSILILLKTFTDGVVNIFIRIEYYWLNANQYVKSNWNLRKNFRVKFGSFNIIWISKINFKNSFLILQKQIWYFIRYHMWSSTENGYNHLINLSLLPWTWKNIFIQPIHVVSID